MLNVTIHGPNNFELGKRFTVEKCFHLESTQVAFDAMVFGVLKQPRSRFKAAKARCSRFVLRCHLSF